MNATSHKTPFEPYDGGIGLLCHVDSIGRGPGQFCETIAKVTNFVTDPSRWFSEPLQNVCG